MTELLAPAGNLESAYAAIHSGADAIYLGARTFSARASADNFDRESLSALLRDAKVLGVKVYLAMNTLVKDVELTDFLDTLVSAWNDGVDAIILQDMALGRFVHEQRPEICLHLSTQAGVCNIYGALLAKEYGFSRVILARETPIDEIEKISRIIETEVFVQGALCTCFSGQCYLSSFIGANSGNRGRCKQPCRKRYTFDRAGYEEPAYAISPADLCIGERIEKLKNLGVISFKIEGRMRRAEYVAAAVSYYRRFLDGANVNGQSLSDLKRTYNRGNYTKGLGFGQDKKFLSRNVQGHLGEMVGVVKVENKKYFVDSSFSPVQGDAFKVLRKGREVCGAFFAGGAKRGFFIKAPQKLCAGDLVFVTTDSRLNERLLTKRRARRVVLSLSFIQGQQAVVEGDGITVVSDFVLEQAKTKPLGKEDVTACFLKTDGLPLEIDFSVVDIQGEIFLPKSSLNEFRRTFYDKLVQSKFLKRNTEKIIALDLPPMNENARLIKAVIADDFTHLQGIDVAIFKPDDYSAEVPANFLNGSFEKYLYMPAFCTQKEAEQVAETVQKYRLDGIYAENYSGLYLAKKLQVRCFAGVGLNVTNSIAANLLCDDKHVSYFTLSKELSYKETDGLLCTKAVTLVGGDLKVMDLCYCPFEKTCVHCDKRRRYSMTDENGREFPMHRYSFQGGNCRFEIYNSVRLLATPHKNAGGLADYTLTEDKQGAFTAWTDEEAQKKLSGGYTYGHSSRGVL